MKKVLLVVGLCLMAQTGFAYDGDRPEPRPQFCSAPGGGSLVPCSRLWNVSLRIEPTVAQPVAQRPAVRQRDLKPVAARKIIRMPWMVGAFQ